MVVGIPPPAAGIGLVVVLDVHEGREADLFEVGRTGDRSRFLTRLGEDREENSRQDGDDGDDDKQFDQSEASTPMQSIVHNRY